jgi:hypothetical protein
VGSVYTNIARKRQNKILHGASRQKWMGNIQSDTKLRPKCGGSVELARCESSNCFCEL